MKKTAVVLITVFALTLAGCVVAGPRVAPPSPRTDVRSARPGPNHIWIQGHWKWTGARYTWVTGHWVKARPGYVWVPGHWQRRGPRWAYIKGHWRRR